MSVTGVYCFALQNLLILGTFSLLSRLKDNIRPRLDTSASLWATLARCGRSSHIQAWGDGVQVLGWPGTGLSVWAVYTPVAQVTERQHLRSASRHLLVVPRFQLDTYAVAPLLSLDRHGTCFKTIYVSRTCKLTVFVVPVHWRRVFLISTRHIERIRGAFCDDALYKLTFTFYIYKTKVNSVL